MNVLEVRGVLITAAIPLEATSVTAEMAFTCQQMDTHASVGTGVGVCFLMIKPWLALS